MALLNQNITSALQTAQPENYDLLPPGTYSLQAEKAELMETKDGFGQYIKVQFNVLGPEYAGRKVFCNFNIRNRSAEAERIGVSQLKAFILAGGVQEPLVDTDQLLGAMVSGKVSIQKSKDVQYEDQNRVGSFKPLSSTPPAAPAATGGTGSFSAAFGRTAASASSPTAQPMPGSSGGSWFK